jgi:hypothetical protein
MSMKRSTISGGSVKQTDLVDGFSHPLARLLKQLFADGNEPSLHKTKVRVDRAHTRHQQRPS